MNAPRAAVLVAAALAGCTGRGVREPARSTRVAEARAAGLSAGQVLCAPGGGSDGDGGGGAGGAGGGSGGGPRGAEAAGAEAARGGDDDHDELGDHGLVAGAADAGADGARAETAPLARGCVRFVVTAADTARVLPARVTVRGVDGTADPDLGPVYRAAGARTLVVAAAGRGELRVPVGTYALTFSHGPEWSIAEERVAVTAGACAEVTARVAHVVPMDDWTACDLHVHARPSYDSFVTVADRVASLVAEGVEFALPSEHDAVGDYGPGVAALPPAASREGGGAGLTWAPAVEVTTDRFGHFNLYPFRPERGMEGSGAPSAALTPSQIFRAARANNPRAIVQVNHPRMRGGMGYFNRVHLDPVTNTARSRLYDAGYDAVEIFNGFQIGRPERVEQVLGDWLALLASGARYVGTASSDSHAIAYRQAGYPRTYVYTPGAGDRAPEPAAVFRALRAGRAFGTSGPMLFARVGDALPGDTARVPRDAEVALEIRVQAAPWIDVDFVDVYRDGVLALTIPVPETRDLERLRRAVPITLAQRRGFVVVVARGDAPMDAVLPGVSARPFAFTNPIWLERARR